jgi:flagellar assembly factor FliW
MGGSKMTVQTSRFGQVEIQESDVLTFPEGMLGFTNLRQFVLLEDPMDEIFVWLQSTEHSEIAFPVLEPEFFIQNYKFELSKNDLEALGLKVQEKLRAFSVITIPEDPRQMTANLKAPIVIHIPTRKARQCVLQDNNLAIREPIFSGLQQRLHQMPNQRIRDVSEKDSPQALSLVEL